MSQFDDALARVDSTMVDRFGESVTYTPDGGVAYALTGVISAGESGTAARLWAPRSSFDTEPYDGDSVTIPAGRKLVAGVYRVSEVSRLDNDCREISLRYVRP